MHRDEAITTIRLLSLRLHYVRHSIMIRPPCDKKEDQELSLFNHLSTMLNTGCHPEHVPAVTGEQTKDAVLATVVISSNSSDHVQMTSPYTITSITPNRMSPQSVDNPTV